MLLENNIKPLLVEVVKHVLAQFINWYLYTFANTNIMYITTMNQFIYEAS